MCLFQNEYDEGVTQAKNLTRAILSATIQVWFFRKMGALTQGWKVSFKENNFKQPYIYFGNKKMLPSFPLYSDDI